MGRDGLWALTPILTLAMDHSISSLEYCELVQDDRSLVCPICQCIFLSPQQISCCKQHICKSCIDKVKNSCPLCRHRPLRYQNAKSEFISSINNALIWCKHKKNGCDWKGELQCLDVHLYPNSDANPNAGCQYEHVPCPLHCGEQIPRWKCLHHQLLSCSQSSLRKLEKQQLKMLSEADMRAKLTSVKTNLEKQIEAVSKRLKTEAAPKLQAEVRAQKEELRRLEECFNRIEKTVKVSKTSSQGVSETSHQSSHLIQKRLDSLEMKMTSMFTMLTEWENTVGRFQIDTNPLNKQITTINEITKKLAKRLDQLEDNMTQPQVNVTRRSDQVEDNMMHRQSHVTVTEIRRRLDQLEDQMMLRKPHVTETRRLHQLEGNMMHIKQSHVNVTRRLEQLEDNMMNMPPVMILSPKQTACQIIASKINVVAIIPLSLLLVLLLVLSIKYIFG